MSLLGNAVICSWFDIGPEHQDNFFEWHSREHMIERLGLPGFNRGRRFAALQGAPEFFVIYEAESIRALSSELYLERLNNPTPWTRTSVKFFRNPIRSIHYNHFSKGTAIGGYVLTIRVNVPEGDGAIASVAKILESVESNVGITGVHLVICDVDVSQIQTEERSLHEQTVDSTGMVILVEAISPERLSALLIRDLTPEHLLDAGITGAVEAGIYQLQLCVTPEVALPMATLASMPMDKNGR